MGCEESKGAESMEGVELSKRGRWWGGYREKAEMQLTAAEWWRSSQAEGRAGHAGQGGRREKRCRGTRALRLH